MTKSWCSWSFYDFCRFGRGLCKYIVSCLGLIVVFQHQDCFSLCTHIKFRAVVEWWFRMGCSPCLWDNAILIKIQCNFNFFWSLKSQLFVCLPFYGGSVFHSVTVFTMGLFSKIQNFTLDFNFQTRNTRGHCKFCAHPCGNFRVLFCNSSLLS